MVSTCYVGNLHSRCSSSYDWFVIYNDNRKWNIFADFRANVKSHVSNANVSFHDSNGVALEISPIYILVYDKSVTHFLKPTKHLFFWHWDIEQRFFFSVQKKVNNIWKLEIFDFILKKRYLFVLWLNRKEQEDLNTPYWNNNSISFQIHFVTKFYWYFWSFKHIYIESSIQFG